ncbi:hypothetical protein BDR26DRAFT_868535 [Obelidium mucronatum]|nr:hypothetical protein BDR26DRAFT_868535 [Obelidium mucronatum]
MSNSNDNDTDTKPKPLRIWVDGCYDLFHFGHANAIRQAKALGGPGAVVVAGVCSDAAILANKGPTVMRDAERLAAVAACKWVDVVVADAPYETSLAWMDAHACGVCVHGDDVTTTADGADCYAPAKRAGRYREFSRTQGVSTTELVSRMLRLSAHRETPPVAAASTFLATASRIAQFSNGKEPQPTDKIVYVHGAFDLFHVGHIEFLKAAKALGDFLIVGVHDDETVNHCYSSSFPIMNVHERVLSVLQCRYVDEVVISAPHRVTDEVLNKIGKVSIVAHPANTPYALTINGLDPYYIPKELGIFVEVEHPLSEMTTQTVMDRIIANRALYEARQAKKMGKAAVEEELSRQEKAGTA